MKRLVFVLGGGLAAACAFADVQPVDGVLSLDVPLGSRLVYTGLFDSSVTRVDKTGGGEAYLSFEGQPAFSGEIAVKEGSLGASYPLMFGSPSAITVSAGASLDVTPENATSTDRGTFNTFPLTIAGFGTNGVGGAVVRRSGGTQDSFFKHVELADDAAISISKRTGITGGTFNMNGHTFVKRGGAEMTFTTENVTNPGNILIENGQFTIQTDAKLNGSASNTLFVTKAMTLCLWNHYKQHASEWTLVVSNGSGNVSTGNAANPGKCDFWNGPVNVLSNNTLSVNTWAAGATLSFAGPFRQYGSMSKTGPGTMNILGNFMAYGAFGVSGGTVNFTGPGPHQIQQLSIGGNAQFNMLGCGLVKQPVLSSSWWNINVTGSAATDRPRFTVGAGAANTGRIPGGGTMRLFIATTKDRFGTAILDEGGALTNRIEIGKVGRGAFIQRGGLCEWSAGDGLYDYIGRNPNSYGYYGMDGGNLLVTGGAFWIACNGSGDPVGFFVQRGGKVTNYAYAGIGSDGYGHLAVLGGTHVMSSDITLGDWGKTNTAYNGEAVVTVSGKDTLLQASALRDKRINIPAIANLNNGGVLSVRRISIPDGATRAQCKFYMNYNGGIIKIRMPWGFNDDWNTTKNSPTRDTVYEGGIGFDTSVCKNDAGAFVESNFNSLLLPPEGMGIDAIALPTDPAFAQEKYVGPPRVVITGTGVAASALCDFDDWGFTNKSIIVTSPGTGYDATTTAKIASADGKTWYDCAVKMYTHADRAASSVGLFKRGAASLQLTQKCSYNGATTVESGNLNFPSGNYPNKGGDINVWKGATLWIGTSGNISVGAIKGLGRVTNANNTFVVKKGIVITAAQLANGENFSTAGAVTFETGATLSVADPENLVDGLRSVTVLKADKGIIGCPAVAGLDTAKWSCFVRGNALKFGYRRGLTVLVK